MDHSKSRPPPKSPSSKSSSSSTTSSNHHVRQYYNYPNQQQQQQQFSSYSSTTASESAASAASSINYEEVLSSAARAAQLTSSNNTTSNSTNKNHSTSSSTEGGGDDDGSSTGGGGGSKNPHSHLGFSEEEAAVLSSLPQRPIANFPSEADRKRIVGCLAAIISMMYDYELWDHRAGTGTGTGAGGLDSMDGVTSNSSKDSTAGNAKGNGNGGKEDVGKMTIENPSPSSQTTPPPSQQRMNLYTPPSLSNTTNANNNNVTNISDSFDSTEELLSSRTLNTKNSSSSSTTTKTTSKSKKTSNRWRRRRKQETVGGGGEQDTNTSSIQQQQEEEDLDGIWNLNSTTHSTTSTISNESSSLPPLHHDTSTTSNSHNNNNNNNNNNNATPTTPTPPSSSSQLRPATMLMMKRHLQRRHYIYTQFLEMSADLLFLEKCHAIAFLPMLNNLLEENGGGNTSTNTNTTNQVSVSSVSGGEEIHVGVQHVPSSPIVNPSDVDLLSSHNQDVQQRGGTPLKEATPTISTATTTTTTTTTTTPTTTSSTTTTNNTTTAKSNTTHTWDKNDLLQPFVESLTPGAGFQCIALLLVNYLLRSGHGYDARIRHAIKKLGVVVIVQELKQMDDDDEYDDGHDHDWNNNMGNKVYRNGKEFVQDNVRSEEKLVQRATRKFEALEHAVAITLLQISATQEQEQQAAAAKLKNKRGGTGSTETANAMASANGGGGGGDNATNANKRTPVVTKEGLLKGLKVGSIGVAAGALFAFTGGLAAPGIAAGIAASGLTIPAATVGVVTALTSTTAVTTIFGVGGGGLIAYKTHRRVKGLTDFSFQRELNGNTKSTSSKDKKKGTSSSDGISGSADDAELFTTVCLSGWLRDQKDFQRPWGVTPTDPPIDRMEKMIRFYSVYKPENVHRCQDILRKWRGDEKQLWAIIGHKYGRDPDHLLPLTFGPRIAGNLTHEEDEILANLVGDLGFLPASTTKMSSRAQHEETKGVISSTDIRNTTTPTKPTQLNHSIEGEVAPTSPETNKKNQIKNAQKNEMMTVWDYHAEYSGELYTVRWESDLLLELCDSVADMAVDLAGNAAREVLKQTALATLITAIAVPYAIVRAASMIDGTWTLAIERADLAGIELARSLLESTAGHRPVTLIGYSMGARTIYSCLKELARHQELWEDQQQQQRNNRKDKKDKKKTRKGQAKAEGKDKITYSREPASIVEDAILMGTPNHLSLHSWELCRCVVAGRLVNCYSKNDLILSLMFQLKRITGVLRPVCGTSAVNVSGVENYDVSHFISAHSDYCIMVPHILRMIRHGQPYRPTSSIVVPKEFIEVRPGGGTQE